MKKIILPLFLCAYALSCSAQISNGRFENWTKIVLFQHPNVGTNTISSNYETFFDNGLLNVYKMPVDDGDVMHIENIMGTDQVQPGYFLFGNKPDENGLFGDGFPVTDSQISGISMDLKYDMADNSEGFVIVQFKNQGQLVGEGNYGPGTYFFPITGSQDWENVHFNFDAPIGETPDKCVIGIASGDVMNSDSPFALGSFIEVDNIKFLGTTDVVPGGDFEGWSYVEPIMVPNDCYVDVKPFELNFEKSINEFEGSFAVKLFSTLRHGNVDVGYLLMGERNGDQITPTIQLDDESSMLNFRYYYSGQDDHGEAHITFYQQDGDSFIQVFEKTLDLEPNENYSLMEYNYLQDLEENMTTADYMAIEFTSSSQAEGNTPKDGSFVLLDDVRLQGTSGIFSAFREPLPPAIYVYPNPTVGRVVFKFNTNRAGYYRVFNGNGTQVDIREFSSTREVVYNMVNKPAGKYVFQFHHNGGVQSARVMKLK